MQRLAGGTSFHMEWRKADLGDSGRARNWMQSGLGLALERRQEGAEIGMEQGGQVVIGAMRGCSWGVFGSRAEESSAWTSWTATDRAEKGGLENEGWSGIWSGYDGLGGCGSGDFL